MSKRSPGFTLIELLIVVVMAAVMLGAIFQTIVVQQRGYRQETAIIKARQTARSSLDLLATELREISAFGGDLVMATGDSLEFRAFRKAGVVCATDVPGNRILVAELGQPFAGGDSVLVFADDSTLIMDDDAWNPRHVSNRSSATCPVTWTAWSGAAQVFLQGSGLPTDVSPGALVRAFEHVTYGPYLIDGQWVVGRHPPGGAVEPLVGPIAAPEDGGLEFRYFDTYGDLVSDAELATVAGRARVASIEILVRGRAEGSGVPGEPVRHETLVSRVALRGTLRP